MSTIVKPLAHDLAVITALETIGKPVGFAQAPAGALEGVQDGTGDDYMCLYPLNSLRDGSLGDPYSDGEFVYQVTCVGRLAAGARYLTGRIEAALAGVAITGRVVTQVIPEDDGAVRPDFDVTPAVFIATPRWRITSVPT